jgi:glucose-1-phosphatase
VGQAKPRAIIFDIGRVLIRVNVSRAMEGLASGLSLTPVEVWAAIEKDPLWMDWQEGRVTPRDWHQHLAKKLGVSLSFERFSEVWNSALDPTPMQEDSFLESLAKKHRLALLSNTDPLHMAHAEQAFPFFRLFSRRVYSYRVGASKPNPLIYREALKLCGVKAQEALYVDDVPAYVEAARQVGMPGIVYKSPEQLRSDLAECGVAV